MEGRNFLGGGLQQLAPRQGDAGHPILPSSWPLLWAWSSRRGHGVCRTPGVWWLTPKSAFANPKCIFANPKYILSKPKEHLRYHQGASLLTPNCIFASP